MFTALQWWAISLYWKQRSTSTWNTNFDDKPQQCEFKFMVELHLITLSWGKWKAVWDVREIHTSRKIALSLIYCSWLTLSCFKLANWKNEFLKKILYELMLDLKTVDWPPELEFNLQVSVTTQLHFFDHPAQEKKLSLLLSLL